MSAVMSEILPGVNLRVLETDRFKTCCMSFLFVQPLSKSYAAKDAVIPRILRRGTKNHPNMESLSAALNELYGARIEPSVRKLGDLSASGFICDFINGSSTAGVDNQLYGTINLLCEILLEPLIDNNAFSESYVKGELDNLSDEIRALINEKLSFAYRRANSLLFKDSGFGLSELGDLKSISALAPDILYKHYKYMIAEAPIEIFFCGSYSFDKVKDAFVSALSKLVRKPKNRIFASKPNINSPAHEIVEHLSMEQAVLLIGLKSKNPDIIINPPALHLFSAVLGGGTASKLFINVREKASLCYYTGTQYNRLSQSVFMYCGINPSNVSETKSELLKQFKACADGEITEDELQYAKRYLIEQLKTADDSPILLENYWVRENAANSLYTPADAARMISNVTLQEVVDAAGALSHVLTYTLSGKAEGSSETKLLP